MVVQNQKNNTKNNTWEWCKAGDGSYSAETDYIWLYVIPYGDLFLWRCVAEKDEIYCEAEGILSGVDISKETAERTAVKCLEICCKGNT